MHESYNQAPPVVQDIGMSMDELVGEMGCTYSLLGMASSHVEMIGRNLREPAQVDSAAYKVDELDYLLIAISQRLKMERGLAIAIKEKGDADYEASPEGQAAIARIRAEAFDPQQNGSQLSGWASTTVRQSGWQVPFPGTDPARGDGEMTLPGGTKINVRPQDQIDRALAGITESVESLRWKDAITAVEEAWNAERERGLSDTEIERRCDRTTALLKVLMPMRPPNAAEMLRKFKIINQFHGHTELPNVWDTIGADINSLIDA